MKINRFNESITDWLTIDDIRDLFVSFEDIGYSLSVRQTDTDGRFFIIKINKQTNITGWEVPSTVNGSLHTNLNMYESIISEIRDLSQKLSKLNLLFKVEFSIISSTDISYRGEPKNYLAAMAKDVAECTFYIWNIRVD